MGARLVIYADKLSAQSQITQIESTLKYPRDSVSYGVGIPPRPGECRALRYAELVESVDGKSFGVPIDTVGEATLSAPAKARIAEVNLAAWAKPEAAAIEAVAEEAVLK